MPGEEYRTRYAGDGDEEYEEYPAGEAVKDLAYELWAEDQASGAGGEGLQETTERMLQEFRRTQDLDPGQQPQWVSRILRNREK